jgi:hypothetical protein
LANVQVWQSQLMANDFPPVCAMTGVQAETWRKFTFTNTPPWAFMFGAIGAAAFSKRVSGYLPLTRQASSRITRVRWLFAGLIPLSLVLFVAGGIVAPSDNDATRGAIAGVLFLLGFAAILVGIVGILIGRNYFGPGARIIERRGQTEPLVELRRVHPAFVAAVQQHQQARAAQLQAAQPPTPPPPPPQSPFPPGKFSY